MMPILTWEEIHPRQLISSFAEWIHPHALWNNRIYSICLEPEAKSQSKTSLRTLVLRDEKGRVQQILAKKNQELALVFHPTLTLELKHLEAIFQEFPLPWVIACHSEHCQQWQSAAQILKQKEIPLLKTHLYFADERCLILPQASSSFSVQPIHSFNPLFSRFIQGFMLETMEQKIDEDEQRIRLQKYEFYGLYQEGQLLSMAALTRRGLRSQCLSYVYTPKKHRGHGLARYLVSELSLLALKKPDTDLVFLYADQSNPSSNHVYRALGFRVHGPSVTF